MEAFKEFAPNYFHDDSDADEGSSIKAIDIFAFTLIGLVFVGSVLLLAFSIVDLMNARSEVKKIHQDIGSLGRVDNSTNAESGGILHLVFQSVALVI